MAKQQIEWDAPEHAYAEKSSDWFWAVGIITVSAAVTAIIFNNVLFALVILIGSFALTMHAIKEPPVRHYKLSTGGLSIDNYFYSYDKLESFWVEEDFRPTTILFKSRRFFMPFIIVPIPDEFDPDDVRDYLREHLPLVEHKEPFLHKLLEYFGF